MIHYSEIFNSFQGEGTYTGKSGPWVRFFGCNLQCNGFGQDDPTDPSTYDLPYKNVDVSKYNKLEDLPIFEKGCDSSYSWHKEYKCLNKSGTAQEVCDELERVLTNEFNPTGQFHHPNTYQDLHLHFTGGEPLLKRNQQSIIAILNELHVRSNCPRYITIETNGTQPLLDDFKQTLEELYVEVFFSISPKLFSVSGEKNEKAIRPDVVYDYFAFARSNENNNQNTGHLKFVVNGTDECWNELDTVIYNIKLAGTYLPIYIMPVGATKESQETISTQEIVKQAIKRGYHISGRLHAHLLGNSIGT